MHRRNWLLAITCALVALLAFAACGGGDDDDDDGGNGGGNTATATRAPTGTDSGDDDSGDDDDDGGSETPTGDGGGHGGDGSEAPVDMCSLLTADEVEAVLGDAAEPEDTSFAPFFTCRWQTENFDYVTVDLFGDSDESNSLYYELSSDAEDVDGFGDRAHYAELLGLEIQTDHYVIAISVNDSDYDEAQTLEQTKALAEKVLDRVND